MNEVGLYSLVIALQVAPLEMAHQVSTGCVMVHCAFRMHPGTNLTPHGLAVPGAVPINAKSSLPNYATILRPAVDPILPYVMAARAHNLVYILYSIYIHPPFINPGINVRCKFSILRQDTLTRSCLTLVLC